MEVGEILQPIPVSRCLTDEQLIALVVLIRKVGEGFWKITFELKRSVVTLPQRVLA